MARSWLHRIFSAFVAAALFMSSLPVVARAQDAKTSSDWEFQITPYLWLSGIGGDVTTPRGLTGSFSQSIGDVLGNLDAGVMVLGEVRYRRWHLLADFDYARLTTDANRAGPIFGQGSLETHEYLGTLAGGYRFVDTESIKLDGLIGVRAISIDNTLSFSGGVLPPRSDSGGQTWADPLVAARVILPIKSGFFANAYGDVGGGPDGDLTWQLYGGFGYSFNRSISAYLGYRYLAINHDVNNFGFDISQQGPLIGVGFRF
jgi:hypothetical protein